MNEKYAVFKIANPGNRVNSTFFQGMKKSKRQDLNLRSTLRSGRPRSRGPLDLVGPLRPEPVPGRILKRSQMSRSGQKWRKINIFRVLRFFDIMFLSKNRQRILLHFYCSPALIGLWIYVKLNHQECLNVPSGEYGPKYLSRATYVSPRFAYEILTISVKNRCVKKSSSSYLLEKP